jgi:hypothetical protein
VTLLIPEPQSASGKPAYGVEPGYYDQAQLLGLLEKHKLNPAGIHFIADMLETGDAENDGFAELLKRVVPTLWQLQELSEIAILIEHGCTRELVGYAEQ